ncbi:MAG: ABC transporter substrate-binding protein [Candidatus Hodarchaeales archaeon]|jgi:ABC-type transport system substrate-binding protein
MQADLDAIGVTTTLKTYDWTEYLDRTEAGEHDMCLLGWSADLADPDNFMYVLLHSDTATVGSAGNVAFYNNSEVDALVAEAQQTTDFATREKNYKDAQWLIHQDSPWVTVAHSQNLAANLDSVSGFQTHPTGAGVNVYANVSKTGATTLTIGRVGDSDTLDPAEATDGQSMKVMRQVYDGLYNLPVDSTVVEPGLATSYSTSADLLNWTFTLREDVKFHDGTPFNASAVVFSFERAFYWADNTSEYYNKGWTPPEAGYIDWIFGAVNVSIVEVSNYVVKFVLDAKYAPFLNTMAISPFAIVSPTYVKAHNGTTVTDRLGLNPIGTGPYKFDAWVKGQTVTLSKNADYWGAAPKTNTLVFKHIEEEATAITEITATTPTIDILDDFSGTNAKTIEDASGVTLSKQAGMNIGYLAMNELRAPFNNKTKVDDPDFGGQTTHASLVRRAFHYAINRPKIIENAYGGYAVQAKNPFPPNIWGYNDTVPDYSYDPAAARSILTSLGYKVKAAPAGPDAITTLATTFGGFAVLVFLYNRKKRK